MRRLTSLPALFVVAGLTVAGSPVRVENPAFPGRAPKEPEGGRRFEQTDVAGYFAEGRLAEAKAAFDESKFERARELLEGQGEDLPVRYLRSLAALRSGAPDAAAQEFQALADLYPPMRERCLAHAGVAYEELGRNEEAAKAFSLVPSGSQLFADARLGLSRALQKKGDLDGARQALHPLVDLSAPAWGRDVAAEALIAVADLSRRSKDLGAERVSLERLWSLHPRSSLAAQAEQRLGGAKRISVEVKVARGETLVELHRNRSGLDVLEPLLPTLALPDPLACRAHFAFGKGLRKERLHTKAIAVLAPVVEQCKEADLRARALYVLGSSRSIVDLPRAAKTYETLAADFPAHSFADDALFFAADVYARSGEVRSALARLEELAAKYPRGDFAAEALFKAFWLRREAKEADEGLRYLDRLEAQFADADESYERERARYWRARTLEEKGATQQAAALFEALAVDHPATYYGLLARTRLDSLDQTRAARVEAELVVPPRGGASWPMFAGPLSTQPGFLTGVELFRLGFADAAAQELRSLDRAKLPPESLRLLVHLLAAAGDAKGAHAVARTSLRKDLSGRVTETTRSIWEVAYPNAFRELIEKHCKAAQGLDPDLLQALMREESALDPQALSWAGALGLTQLMPYTAKAVAAQLRLKGLTTSMLLDPDVNIRLGATYLSSLSRRYRGVKQHALAGYNAGESAVDRWMRERPTKEIDEWVENIPIAETRGYVKRVLRSYNTYRLLYAPAPASSPSTGPSQARSPSH